MILTIRGIGLDGAKQPRETAVEASSAASPGSEARDATGSAAGDGGTPLRYAAHGA